MSIVAVAWLPIFSFFFAPKPSNAIICRQWWWQREMHQLCSSSTLISRWQNDKRTTEAADTYTYDRQQQNHYFIWANEARANFFLPKLRRLIKNIFKQKKFSGQEIPRRLRSPMTSKTSNNRNFWLAYCNQSKFGTKTNNQKLQISKFCQI